MKILILAIFLWSSCQINNSVNDNEKKVSFHHKEKLPEFKGGIDSLDSWLKREMKFPNTVVKEGIRKEVVIRFFIDTLGKVNDVSIIKSSSNEEFDKDALRAVKSMPQWEKGTLGAYFNLPIYFIGNKED